jgi:ATP-dependent Clp protease ATP-binding subunit ClpB
LGKGKAAGGQERIKKVRQEIAAINEELRPLKTTFEIERERGEDIYDLRRRIDGLMARIDDATRQYVSETAMTHAHIVFSETICLKRLFSDTKNFQAFKPD